MIQKLLEITVLLLTFELVFVVLNLSLCFIFKLVSAIGTYIVISYNVLIYFIHLASDSSFYLLHNLTADCCSFENAFFLST